MLEIKDVSKIYKSKKSEVKALDHINLTIQDKGMVFILGKSGSGKSTLVHVIGGLDQFDSGEIIICGKSSKDFKQSDFDSYRNTFIGFIFQEYNIMDNFTVKDNIALALQLQGKKADEKVIDHILKEVDLEDFKDRKPNELSGGQLQRVAIARALIKNPEIIMADEPTGALDSRTSKQVLDTLKKLSKEKLVLIVSHDKEFAKNYADRIIELADGKIISDTSKEYLAPHHLNNGIDYLENEFIHIKECQNLLDDDIYKIISTLKGHHGETIISLNQQTNQEIKKTKHIDENGQIEIFQTTNAKHMSIKDYTKESITFIKSKLPLKSSIKIALSNLKLKPLRLFMTIVLSVASFTLFGLTNAFSQYDKEVATFHSIKDSQIDYIAISKNLVIDQEDYTYELTSKLNRDDYKLLKQKFPQFHFTNTFSSSNLCSDFNLTQHIANENKLPNDDTGMLYQCSLSSLASIDAQMIDDNHFDLTGTLPQNDNEIVITDFSAQIFKKFGYQIIDDKGKATTFDIFQVQDLIGKTIKLTINSKQYEMKICGILDTHIDLSRYEALTNENSQGVSSYYLTNEFHTLMNYSYHNMAFINPAMLENIIADYHVYPVQKDNIFLDIYINDENYYSEFLYNYNDVDQNQFVHFNNDGSVYLNYHTIKNIKVNSQRTIEDEVYDNVSHPNNQQEVINAIKKVIQKYQNNILNSQIKISYSGDQYYENIIDKIAGIYIDDISNESHTYVFKDKLIKQYNLTLDGYSDGVVSSMCNDETLKDVIKYTYDDKIKETNYVLNNQVMPMLSTVNSAIFTLKDILFYLAIGFAIFASMLFCNFIATSIANKKHEIGILRAVGARSIDILKIFLNESLIIAGINWIFACGMGYLSVHAFNSYIRNEFNVIVTVLDFNFLQIALLLLISISVAFISSAIPVYKISKKKPIDAIKNRK